MSKELNDLMIVIGVMSGTSFDSISVAAIETDGAEKIKRLGFQDFPYDDDIVKEYKDIIGKTKSGIPSYQLLKFQKDITLLTIKAVNATISSLNIDKKTISFIAFHGQTIFHDPSIGCTMQLGDPALLASGTQVPVYSGFRPTDMAMGGQGAPILPIYQKAIMPKNSVYLNIGGVANITYCAEKDEDIIAFDTGPGNALIDDLVSKNHSMNYDKDGLIASSITSYDQKKIDELLKDDYFMKPYPKSLDREHWKEKTKDIDYCVKTLTELTVQSIVRGIEILPNQPEAIIVAGGGRNNLYIMKRLQELLKSIKISKSEDIGLNGNALEAEGMAYIGARVHRKLPVTFPNSTGCTKPNSGANYFSI